MSKKLTKDIEINGTQYKEVVKVKHGEIEWIKNAPKVPAEVHASGLHVIINKPEEEHYDHKKSDKQWKEYTRKEGEK